MSGRKELTPRGIFWRVVAFFAITITLGMSVSGAMFTRGDSIPPGHEQDVEDLRPR